MINYDNYSFDNWGLSKDALSTLETIIIDNNCKRAIEFGSGQSTYFLKDIGIEYISFDNDTKYSAKLDNVFIKDLVKVDDDSFDKIIKNQLNFLDISENFPIITTFTTRQKNCFYRLSSNDFNEKYDLVILDGPNGNGRSIAFNVIKPYLMPTSYILIDDYSHYPFIDHLLQSYPNSELIKVRTNGMDIFALYKIDETKNNR